jgi:hypothetical protein
MIENFAGDGNQNEIVAAVAFTVGNSRRPVEPVEFAPVEFLSVNACVNNLDHPCSFDQLILRDENQNAAQTKAALQNETA